MSNAQFAALSVIVGGLRFFLYGRGESGWCSDVTSTHGAWRHAGVRFLLPGDVGKLDPSITGPLRELAQCAPFVVKQTSIEELAAFPGNA